MSNNIPDFVSKGYELCLLMHDILAELVASGHKEKIFTAQIKLANLNQEDSLNRLGDIFLWLETEELFEQRAVVLKTVVLPAVIKDMLDCIYEGLMASRKSKLNITFMLIRKPIQESLYLLESMVLDEFTDYMVNDPLKLRQKNAGGIDNHSRRINIVLERLQKLQYFDPVYIAKLRYDKTSHDSFDGVCNHAMHLFTEHKAIKTSKLHINFIFSGNREKNTQYKYLYSRFPYLMYYTYCLIEHLIASICLTRQEYLDDIFRRISASILLWGTDLDDDYCSKELQSFISMVEITLQKHCAIQFTSKDLVRMSKNGAYPGETDESVKSRIESYSK